MLEDSWAAVATYIGVFGAATYIVAYSGLQMGKIPGVGYTYPILNTVAAGCVLVSLTASFNLSSAIIQVSWIGISAMGMLRIFLLSRGMHFNAEETEFLKAKLPRLSRPKARKVLDLGHWVAGAPGVLLTRESMAVRELIYLQDGEASVRIGDREIGLCQSNMFIGELTCLAGDPATATVALTRPSRYLCLNAGRLRDLAAREPEIQMALNDAFANDIRSKLLIANQNQIAETGTPGRGSEIQDQTTSSSLSVAGGGVGERAAISA